MDDQYFGDFGQSSRTGQTSFKWGMGHTTVHKISWFNCEFLILGPLHWKILRIMARKQNPTKNISICGCTLRAVAFHHQYSGDFGKKKIAQETHS